MQTKIPELARVVITLPIPGFVSVVGLAVGRFAGDGVQFAPSLPLG